MLAPLTLQPDPWDDALCRDQSAAPVNLWFSDAIVDIDRAKSLCTECPLMAPCLEGAKERREPCGVWGGQLFKDGAILAFKRPRGRPPKVRPDAVEDDEVALTA